MQELLNLWGKRGITWNCVACDDKPHSVELECYTDAGEDMIIDLEEISADALEEYVNNFDINYNVSIWWVDGEKGRGVPFENQAEQVEDYKKYLARLRDVIDESRGKKRKKNEMSHLQQLYVDKLLSAAEALEDMGVSFTWSKNKGFKFKDNTLKKC